MIRQHLVNIRPRGFVAETRSAPDLEQAHLRVRWVFDPVDHPRHGDGAAAFEGRLGRDVILDFPRNPDLQTRTLKSKPQFSGSARAAEDSQLGGDCLGKFGVGHAARGAFGPTPFRAGDAAGRAKEALALIDVGEGPNGPSVSSIDQKIRAQLQSAESERSPQ